MRIVRTILGIICGLIVGYALLILFNILFFPVNLFLMSDLSNEWGSSQEVAAYIMGITSLVIIAVCGILGGRMGFRWNKSSKFPQKPK